MADIDLKTLTPTSLPPTGFLFGADSQAVGTASPSVYSTQTVATTLLGSTSLTGDTLTADAPVLNLAQTWNSSGVTFTGMKFNAAGTSDANSAAASLLMDLQVNTSGRFRVIKTGQIVLPYSATTDWVSGNVSFGNRFGAPTLQNATALMNMDTSGNVNTGGGGGLGSYQINGDTILSRKAIRNFRFGAADAATALAQTLSVQSVVAGTSNTAGADFTLTGSQNTGTGLAGNLIVSTGFSNTVGTATVTITIATPGVITWTAHGLVTGSPVVFTTTGALPTGITAGTTYFAITSSTLGVNTFQIATTAANAAAGTAITTSGTQSGVHTGTTSATVQSPLMTTTTFGPSGLTGSQTTPVLDIKQNWNTSGNATGIKLNVTNAASGASALLMDLQVDTATKFKVDKLGNVYAGNPAAGFSNTGIMAVGAVFGASGGTPALISGGQALFYTSHNKVGEYIFGTRLKNNSAFTYEWSSTTLASGATDLTLSRKGAANLQLGAADAATALAQTLSVQSVVAGTSNTAGAAFTVNGSQGTGTGAGGSLIFQVAPAGSASTFTVTFTNGSATINGTGLPTTAGTAVAFTTTGALPTNFAINTTYFILAGSTSTAITVAATAGGTAIVAGSAGSGTQTLTQALAQNALAAAMTIASDYSAAFVGNLRLADGTSSVASLGFNNGGSYNLGFYKAGTNSIGIISSSGVYARLGGNSNAFFMRSDAFLSWSSTTGYAAADTILLRDDANTLAQRNSTAAQAFRVYKTYSDASNYERGVFDWTTTANQLTIGTQKLGSGTARPLELQTDGTAVLTLATDGSVTQSGTYFKLNNRLATCQVWIGSESAVSAFVGTITNTPLAFRANNTSWLTISTTGLLQLQGATSSFPALKRSTTFLQARLADDSAFTNIQGKLTTDTAYTAGALVATGYITIYDSTGTAYRVPCLV